MKEMKQLHSETTEQSESKIISKDREIEMLKADLDYQKTKHVQ